MCAALNLCGWAHACHTLDVDVLLFGALTVYRQMHLQVRAARLRLCSVGHASVEIGRRSLHCNAMQMQQGSGLQQHLASAGELPC